MLHGRILKRRAGTMSGSAAATANVQLRMLGAPRARRLSGLGTSSKAGMASLPGRPYQPLATNGNGRRLDER